MTERMLADPMQSSRSKLGSMRAVVESILRIFAGCAAVIKPTRYSSKQPLMWINQHAEGAVEESAAVANSTTAKAFDFLITADVKAVGKTERCVLPLAGASTGRPRMRRTSVLVLTDVSDEFLSSSFRLL